MTHPYFRCVPMWSKLEGTNTFFILPPLRLILKQLTHLDDPYNNIMFELPDAKRYVNSYLLSDTSASNKSY